jgi:hypothetical protein
MKSSFVGGGAFALAFALPLSFAGCTSKAPAPAVQQAATTPDTAQITQQAFIYAYPMLFNYKTIYERAVDTQSKDYIGFNKFKNYSRAYTAADVDIVTPNNDTPYSWAVLDLRADPVVLSTPDIPKKRYVVFQLVDLYTQNFGYVGVRTTGYKAGHFMIAGPKWNGDTPKGIDKVVRSESDFVLILGRTNLDGAWDLPAVVALQKQYHLGTLSEFEKQPAPPAVPAINWPAWNEGKALSPDFIQYTNFLLQFCEPHEASEVGLMADFAKIGIAAGAPFNFSALPASEQKGITQGVAAGKAQLEKAESTTTSSFDLFGNRQELHGDYQTRAVAAAMGIYGNTKQEAVYVGTRIDSDGIQLVGSTPYEIHFSKSDLSPAKFFWSMTLYSLPDRHLVANPINRYSIGDRTKGLKYGPDGSLTLYVQHDPPADDKTANWLPAPIGPYDVIMRIYGPDDTVLNGTWQLPKPTRSPSAPVKP